MKNITCCFTGHRDLPKKDLERIITETKSEVIKLINRGVRYFISGGAIGFDMLCGKIISELKCKYPDIRLIMALPCENQEKFWNEAQKQEYNKLLSSADALVYVSTSYFRGCMHKRNRFMVDNSFFVISYCTRQTGGTAYTLKYAGSKGKSVINLTD